MQEKQTVISLQKQNKSIREMAETLGVAKSTVWHIQKDRIGDLSNIKCLEVHEKQQWWMIGGFSHVKTTPSNVNNTLLEEGVIQSLQSGEDFTIANTEGSPQGANHS